MKSKLAKEKMKEIKIQTKLKEKAAILAFKKYFELTKKVGRGTLLEDKTFVHGALAKIDGHYFFPIYKGGEKRIRIIKEASIKHNIFAIDAALAEGVFWPAGKYIEYLRTEVEEDVWDMTFHKNGKPKGIVDILHGNRDLGRIYLGEVNSDRLIKKTLEEVVASKKNEIGIKLRKYLEDSLCSTIEDLLQQNLRQKKKNSR